MNKIDNNQRYEINNVIEDLKAAEGRGTEMVSLYIPPNRAISDITAYLRNEYSQSENIKSSSTRKNVQSAISSLLSELKKIGNTAPDNGLALFAGENIIGNNKTRLVKYTINPPVQITNGVIYRCDSKFFTEPLEGLLKEEHVYGLFVIDRGGASIGILRGERIEVVKTQQSIVPRKHGQGGQSQARMHRIIEQLADEWFKQMSEVANDVFLRENVKGIIIGGPGYTKQYVLDGPWLHHELKKRIIGVVDCGDTDEHGLQDLVHNAQVLLRNLGLTRERDLLHRFFDGLNKDNGLVAYGEIQVQQALQVGAVDTLLVSDKKSRDFIKEVSVAAANTGSKVEIISDATEEGKQLLRGFGGVVAILRYSLGDFHG